MNYILNQKKELKFGNLSIIKKLKIKEFICSNIKILVLAQIPIATWSMQPSPRPRTPVLLRPKRKESQKHLVRRSNSPFLPPVAMRVSSVVEISKKNLTLSPTRSPSSRASTISLRICLQRYQECVATVLSVRRHPIENHENIY